MPCVCRYLMCPIERLLTSNGFAGNEFIGWFLRSVVIVHLVSRLLIHSSILFDCWLHDLWHCLCLKCDILRSDVWPSLPIFTMAIIDGLTVWSIHLNWLLQWTNFDFFFLPDVPCHHSLTNCSFSCTETFNRKMTDYLSKWRAIVIRQSHQSKSFVLTSYSSILPKPLNAMNCCRPSVPSNG